MQDARYKMRDSSPTRVALVIVIVIVIDPHPSVACRLSLVARPPARPNSRPQITRIPHPAGRPSSASKPSSPSSPRGLHRAIRSATLCESQWIPGALHPPAPWDPGRIQGDWQDREIPSHPRRAVRCHARAIRAANCCAQPLSARGLSFGEINGAATRALPGTLPAGAPLDNVGTERALHCGGCAPNIVKDGTPLRSQRRHPAKGKRMVRPPDVLSSPFRSHRRSDTRTLPCGYCLLLPAPCPLLPAYGLLLTAHHSRPDPALRTPRRNCHNSLRTTHHHVPHGR
jgi:hypothetical protein